LNIPIGERILPIGKRKIPIGKDKIPFGKDQDPIGIIHIAIVIFTTEAFSF